MRLRNSLLAVAAIACATFGTSAYAGQDSKILAGNACQFADVTTIVNPSFAFDSGRILNTADIPVSVICPVVRDNTTNTDGTLAVQVRVNGGNDQDVLCTVTSRDRFAKFLRDDFGVGGKDGPQTITLDVNTSVASGAYELTCLLPPRGAVLTYQITEFTPTEELP